MTQDARQASQLAGKSGQIVRPAARLALAAVCGGGLLVLGVALISPDLEWRLLAMVALTFAVGPLTAELRTRRECRAIRLPLLHGVLFASSLALGPVGSALPGAFSGIARLLLGPDCRRPVWQALYVVLKPAAVCASAALVYVGTGGSALRPQEVDSFAPLLCAAVTYMTVNALLVGVVDELHPSEPVARVHAPELIAGWMLCFFSGYPLAVLYAFAPSYVLLAPAVAVGLAHLSLRETTRKTYPGAGRDVGHGSLDDLSEPQASMEFVDPTTGLANQRYLNMFLQREVSRAERTGKPLSVAIFDVDGFRGLMSTAEPEEVNQALVDAAGRLKLGLRDYDLIGRYSPGRFIAVLPEAAAETAFEVAERLHESVTSLSFCGKPISVTVGIATFPEHASTADELVNSAHHALNRGRFAGANCVYSFHILAKAS